MAQYLNMAGVTALWGKIKNTFALKSHSHDYLPSLRLTNPSNGTTYTGAIPFILALKAAGTPRYDDPEFKDGNNSCHVYNNSGNGNVTITRITDDQNSANSSGYILKIYNNGETTSPGLGGFYQTIQSRAGAVFCQIFRAKIPTGYSIKNAENSMGDDYTTYWLTDRSGTGKWEWYCRVTICGISGTMSSGGHVYLEGNGPVTWYMSYCNVIDLSKGDYDGLKVKYADSAGSAVDQTARNAASAAQTTANSKWTYNADTIRGVKVNNAVNADRTGSLYIGSIGSGSDSHASALQNYFNNYKTSIPRNSTLGLHSSSYGNGSQYMGYFLSGYNDTPYGGFFVAHYDSCYYVGISYGNYNQQTIITSNNIGSQSVNYADSAGSVAWTGVTGKPSTFTPSSHTHSYLPLSGGTLSASTSQISRGGSSTSWYLGRSNAMLKISSYSGYNAITSMKTTNGDWSMGVYTNDIMYFTYVTDSNFNAGNNTTTAQIYFNPSGHIYATAFYQSSDERLKTFHDPIKVDLDKLKKLRKNYFKFNDKDKLEIGVSAQEVQEIYPELVTSDEEGYLSVAYDKLSVIALAAIDKLDDDVKELKELKQENNELKNRLNNLESILKEKGIL